MCYTRRKIEGGVDALREFDDTNFLKPNGQSRNLNIYGLDQDNGFTPFPWLSFSRTLKYMIYI